VIQTQPLALVPGSSEPMKPVRVKTVQVKAGAIKLASAAPTAAPLDVIPARAEVAETSGAIVDMADATPLESGRNDARMDLPQQPAGHGTGHGILGVLPASSHSAAPQAFASADPTARIQPQAPAKPSTHTGWIVQVGALESEGEAQQRIEAARNSARGLLNKADPFTEVVAKENRKLFRARFAGLERDQAEAVCRTLRRADISCMTVHNN
jgi:D-alanyl-D-alanine carboxypeptidase